MVKQFYVSLPRKSSNKKLKLPKISFLPDRDPENICPKLLNPWDHGETILCFFAKEE